MLDHNPKYNESITIEGVANGFVVTYKDFAYVTRKLVFSDFEILVNFLARHFGIIQLGDIPIKLIQTDGDSDEHQEND
jgi:hypothetical protein